MKYYKLQIDRTSRSAPNQKSFIFDQETKTFRKKEAIKEFLIEQYGKIPKGKNKIYIDDIKGNPQEIGFMHSFWCNEYNRDTGRYENYFQTDWISITEVREKPIKLI